MKIRKRKAPRTPVDAVEVDVVVRFPPGHPPAYPTVTHAQAEALDRAVRDAMVRVFPNTKIRGLWVHGDLPRDYRP